MTAICFDRERNEYDECRLQTPNTEAVFQRYLSPMTLPNTNENLSALGLLSDPSDHFKLKNPAVENVFDAQKLLRSVEYFL